MKLAARLSVMLPFLILFSSKLYSQDSSAVIAQIRQFEKTVGGRIGVMAKNLDTGEQIGYRASEKFPTASVIKLPVMVEYFFQVKEGKVSPTQEIELSDANKWGGSGLFQFFNGMSQQKLTDAVLLMITISDNTATNMVIDALGRTHAEKLAAVNDRMVALGLKNTRLLNKLMSWETKTNSPESIRYGVGVSTPGDMNLLCEKIFRREIVDSAACDAMIDLMKKQFYNDKIPRFLPKEEAQIRVAHKTGSVTGVSNDVGLILSPRANISLAIFIEEARDRRGG
ncbi:MAG: serine hydrolase, partial [Calditrichaeota bacterium]|nr:serine hydrolase [Calditrichota bacterium]